MEVFGLNNLTQNLRVTIWHLEIDRIGRKEKLRTRRHQKRLEQSMFQTSDEYGEVQNEEHGNQNRELRSSYFRHLTRFQCHLNNLESY